MKTLMISLFALIANSFVGFSQVNHHSAFTDNYYRTNVIYYRTTYNNTVNDSYFTYPNIIPNTEKALTIEPTSPTYTSPNYYSIPTYSPSTISAPSYSPLYSQPSYSYPTYSTTPIHFFP